MIIVFLLTSLVFSSTAKPVVSINKFLDMLFLVLVPQKNLVFYPSAVPKIKMKWQYNSQLPRNAFLLHSVNCKLRISLFNAPSWKNVAVGRPDNKQTHCGTGEVCESEELCLRRGFPLACRVMCFFLF